MSARYGIKKAAMVSLLFLTLLFAYLNSMPATYNSDDSPETTTAFYTLGIQHPPGYPLITLLGKAFLQVPLGNVMFRANLLSVILNLAAAFMIYLLAKKVLRGFFDIPVAADVAAGSAALMYALSSSSWLQGVIAKGSIYSLNALLTASFLYALVRIKEAKKYFYLFCLLYGLSLANHWTSSAVMAPAIMAYFAALAYEKYRVKKEPLRDFPVGAALLGAVFFAAGVFVYAYAFIRSASSPVYAWGDIRTFKELMWLVSRSQYSSIETQHKLSDTLSLLSYYSSNLLTKEFPLMTALIMVPGAYFLFKKRPAETVLLAGAYVMIVVSVASFATPPKNTQWLTKPYLVSSNIFAALFAAAFFSWLHLTAAGLFRKIMVPALAVYCALFFFNSPSYSSYYVGYDYTRNLIKTIPRGSVVYAEGDMNIGALLYASLVEKNDFVPIVPVVMQYEWYRAQLRRNYGARYTPGVNDQDMMACIQNSFLANRDKSQFYTIVYNPQWVGPIQLQHNGLLFKMSKPDEHSMLNDINFALYSFRGAFGKKLPHDEFTQRLTFDNYGAAYFYFGDILRQARNNQAAVRYYERGLLFAKNESALVNLGLSYYQMADLGSAEKAWRRALEVNPKSSIAYSNLAFINYSKGDFQGARAMLTEALRYDPNNLSAQQLMQSLQGR